MPAPALTASPSTPSAEPPETEPEPYARFRSRSLEYPGPGREQPDPAGLSEVRIGWFAPYGSEHHQSGDAWVAAQLAVDEANAAGGFDGLPYRLQPRWSDTPWGNGAALVAQLAYDDEVWGIVGSLDGPTTHLAEQVVAKARLPLVSPIATDSSVNLAGVSWMFSCVPGDHLSAPVLAAAVAAALPPAGSLAMMTTTDHDSRLTASAITAELDRQGLALSVRLDLPPGVRDVAPRADRVATHAPAAIIVVADPADSARMVVALRHRLPETLLFGSHQMGRREFLRLASDAGEGVRFPLLLHPEHDEGAAERLARGFRQRTGRMPDYAAAHTYDAVRLLLAAVDRGGLNRARIRDQLAAMSPWLGVSGTIHWDGTGQNDRPVHALATVRNGRVEVLDRP